MNQNTALHFYNQFIRKASTMKHIPCILLLNRGSFACIWIKNNSYQILWMLKKTKNNSKHSLRSLSLEILIAICFMRFPLWVNHHLEENNLSWYTDKTCSISKAKLQPISVVLALIHRHSCLHILSTPHCLSSTFFFQNVFITPSTQAHS